MSLVDEDRQWFKSVNGLVVRSTSREVSFCGHAILGEDVFVVNDAAVDERFSDNPLVLDDPSIRFYAGHPLLAADGSSLGTFCLIDRKPRDLTPEDMQSLEDLALLAERELLSRQLATTDDLTGISNRRGFHLLANNRIRASRRGSGMGSLLYFDMDGLKRINDSLGHAVGDAAIIEFSRLLIEFFRESDVVARLGGDEFVVLLMDSGESATRQTLERFAEFVAGACEQSDWPYTLKASAGVIQFEADANVVLDDLLAQADQRMYQAKKGH